jgi:hypothetical protein
MFLEFSNREILQTRFIIKKKVNPIRTSEFAKKLVVGRAQSLHQHF